MKTLQLVDTSDFMDWAMKKYNMTNSEWHDKIWHGESDMCERIINGGPYITYERTENPENLLEEHVNEFLDEFPDFNGQVSFIFTN
jgi:hypothetical protein